MIYLDFSKAFDKVPHKRLLHKIESHGISGNVAAWIGEWLCDRKQQVVLNGKFSRLQDVLSGVPQGSVLGPILFLIFVNDIDTVVSSHIQKFADDCKVYRSHPTAEDIDHTGQCKRTGGCYNELVVAFLRTGGGLKGKKIYTS